ncbi:MAG: DNA methyltransferase [Hydrotalea sp.]|nr:DNA methyltransferase [Hydrotalea sp.]
MLNVKNRTVFCHDNIDILRGINSNCIDLVYLDPPFNKKKIFTAPIGSSAEGAEFRDIFSEEDVKDEWVKEIEAENYQLYSLLLGIKEFSNKYNYCYCVYMAIRLIEIHRVLKETGSVYLHCDPTMSHYLKLVLDCIFGEKNFRNEVIWAYKRWTAVANKFQKLHDIILYYAKSDAPVFNTQYDPYGEWIKKDYGYTDEETGKRWRWHTVKGNRYKVFLEDESRGVKTGDWWEIPPIGSTAKERTGYPTQKPLILLERIIKASSNEGDMVLDPFCGCATACVAAERLGRRWVGIDVSYKAYELVKERLNKEKHTIMDWNKEIHDSTAPPKRTDGGAGGAIAGYIYIISNKAYKGQLKVGVAKDPKARLNNYQTSDPKRGFTLEKAYQTPFNIEIETMIHNHYQSLYEWVATDDIEEVFNQIKEFEKQIKKEKGAL